MSESESEGESDAAESERDRNPRPTTIYKGWEIWGRKGGEKMALAKHFNFFCPWREFISRNQMLHLYEI